MAANIEDLRALSEPLKVHNFELQFMSLPGGGSVDDMRLRVDASSIPGVAIEPIVVSLQGHEATYPGRIRYSHMWRVEVNEYEDVRLMASLYDWHQLLWNRSTGTQSTPDQYKTDVLVQVLNSSKGVARTFTLIGVWIQEFGEVGMDYKATANVKFPIVFCYDYFR